MDTSSPFTWRHFEGDMMQLCVRWSLRDALSSRDGEELARERGLSVDQTSVFRWVHRYAPEGEKRCRPHLKATNDSSRVDETYLKINKPWRDLDRVVGSTGAPGDFMLSPRRDTDGAERLFRKVLGATHTTLLCVMTVDKQ